MMQASMDRMMEEIARVLNQRVHSAWLYGSVVLDDFHLGWSDIDCVVLAQDPIIEA